MIRLLIIGRPADDWSAKIGAATADDVHIDTARLPSAGIRQFEETPADLIAVADDRGGERVETLVDAIRQRPLGRLVPLLVISPLPDDADLETRLEELNLVDWLSPDAKTSTVIDRIEMALETELSDASKEASSASSGAFDPSYPQAQRSRKKSSSTKRSGDAAPVDSQGADGSASYFDGNIVLEPVENNSRDTQTGSIDRNSIFRGSHSRVDDGHTPVSGEELKRKLQAVRHDDYYAVLDVRRGAESQTVREAFRRLYERFDPDSISFELVRQHQDDIDEIRDALEDAFAVLGDPDLRQAYLDHTVK